MKYSWYVGNFLNLVTVPSKWTKNLMVESVSKMEVLLVSVIL
jgi:hypothetical protein